MMPYWWLLPAELIVVITRLRSPVCLVRESSHPIYVYSAPNTLSSSKSGSICNPLAHTHTVVSDDTLWVSEANWKFMAARVCDLLLRWNIHAAKCAMKYDTRTDVGNICCTWSPLCCVLFMCYGCERWFNRESARVRSSLLIHHHLLRNISSWELFKIRWKLIRAVPRCWSIVRLGFFFSHKNKLIIRHLFFVSYPL